MPETLGFLILNAAGIDTIAGFAVTASTATIVGDVALASLSIGASLLLNRPGAQTPQDGQQTVQQASAPRRRNYGIVKVGGAVLFSEVGSAGAQRYQILAINQGEIDSFVSHWYDDNELELDSENRPSALLNGYYRVGTTPYTVLDFKYGTDDDTTFTQVAGGFPTLWTAAHQGNGIAKVMVALNQPKAADFTSTFPGGAAPVYRAVIQSAKVWDPRDATQDRNDKTSWKYSVNPVLHALDYHRVPDGMGLSVFDSIFFTDAAITQDWIPSANICDEAIPLKEGGTAARYTCAGGYVLSDAPKTVLASIFSTCDGQTYQRSDGAIGIRVGKTIAPSVTLDDDDIVGYQSLRRGPSDSLVPVNQVTAKYTASLFDFQENDAQPWQDLTAIATAGGRIESRDIDLRWVYLHPQARRLMKLAQARLTPEWSGKIVTNLGGLRAWSERFVTVVIPELDIDGSFEVTSFDHDPTTCTCTIGISALDQSALDWDPATEEGSESVPPNQDNSSVVIPDPTTVAATATGHVITATWDPPVTAVETFVTAEAQYSVHGAANWFDMAVAAGPWGVDTGTSAVSPVLPAGTYDVQVSFVSGSVRSDWVPILGLAV